MVVGGHTQKDAVLDFSEKEQSTVRMRYNYENLLVLPLDVHRERGQYRLYSTDTKGFELKRL